MITPTGTPGMVAVSCVCIYIVCIIMSDKMWSQTITQFIMGIYMSYHQSAASNWHLPQSQHSFQNMCGLPKSFIKQTVICISHAETDICWECDYFLSHVSKPVFITKRKFQPPFFAACLLYMLVIEYDPSINVWKQTIIHIPMMRFGRTTVLTLLCMHCNNSTESSNISVLHKFSTVRVG